MGKCQRKKGSTAKHKQYGKNRRTRNETKDLDQIVEDLQPEKFLRIQNPEIDENLPGLGQFYCVFCARYFVNQKTLDKHYKAKEHKKRVKVVQKEKAYTKIHAGKAKNK